VSRRPAPFPAAPSVRRSPLPLLAALGAIAASLVLAACGGSSSPSSATKEQAQEQQLESKFVEFAACLREHGIKAEVMSHPGGGHGLKVGPGGAGDPHAVEAAEKACARYRPPPQNVNVSPQQKVEHEENAQKFAKCMREHGIKTVEATAGGDVRIGILHSRGGGGPNPESPGFKQAQSACQKLLPGPPP
jgi:hypothetical protein